MPVDYYYYYHYIASESRRGPVCARATAREGQSPSNWNTFVGSQANGRTLEESESEQTDEQLMSEQTII